MSNRSSTAAKPILSAFVVAALSGVAAAGTTVETTYHVDVSGVTVMKISYSATIAPGQYQSRLVVKTSGMAKLLSEYRMDLGVSGSHSGPAFQPLAYDYNRKKKGKWKSTSMAWSADGKLATGQLDEGAQAGLLSALQERTVDPLSAILKIGTTQGSNPCSGKHRVFDGKDLFDLVLSFSKKVTLASVTASTAEISALECKVNYVPVAGKSVDEGDTAIETYGLWLAPFDVAEPDRVIYMPVRITGKIKGMAFVADSKAVNVNGQPVGQ